MIAEGTFTHAGVLNICALGFPPCEERHQLPGSARAINFFGGQAPAADQLAAMQASEVEADNDRIVFLSDVHLDQQPVLDNLHTILSGELFT